MEDCIRKAALGFRSFSINVHGVGWFGSSKSARVVWVGLREGREEMARLADALEKNLSGFRPADKHQNPHITICRPKGDTTALIQDIERMKERGFGRMAVSGVILKSSTLTPQGSVYADVRAFALGQ